MNNVICKRVYEKAWRSHLHTGLMLKAREKQPNQRRKSPQIYFKENYTFYRHIPKQLHAARQICCGYSIKCSAFYSPCLCWSLSGRGLGEMQHGKRCCGGKHCMRTITTLHNCDPSQCRKRIWDHTVSDTCVIDVDLDIKPPPVSTVCG